MRNSHFRSFALSIAVLLASPFPAPAAAPPASTAPAPALFTDQDPLVSAAQSLQHWWPADGHSLDLVAHRHAALKDGATFAPGRVGQAFTFDGLKNYVDCGKANPSTPADAFTFMLWFRAERQTGWQYLAFCWGDSGLDVNINDSQPDIVAGQLGLGVGYEDSWRKTWNNAAASFKPTDQWHHVAVTFDSRKIQLFRDGTLAKETPWTIYTPSTTPLLLGAADRDTGGNIFKGQIQDVALFTRALTAAEIAACYQAQTTPPPMKITDAELQKFDAALAADPAPLAWYAAQRLPSDPAATLAHFAKAAPSPAPETTLAALIQALDSDSYQERERASAALAAYGTSIAPTLRAALTQNPSPEVANRIQLLLAAHLTGAFTPAQLPAARRAAILSRINTPQAKDLIDRLPS